MPVQKDIEEGISTPRVENNDTTSNNNTINNSEASIESHILSSPPVNTSTNLNDGNVSHTLPPPPEDTEQSTFIANLQNTSHDHNGTEQGYTQSTGLVQIHDDENGPLPPIAALNSIPDSSDIAVGRKKIQGKLEQFEDSTAPPLPTTAFDNSDIKRKIAQESRIDTINDEEEDAPVPFNVADLDIEEDAKIKSRQINSSRDDSRGRDSIAIPTSDDLENDTEVSTLRNRDGSGVRGVAIVDRARIEMAPDLEQSQNEIPIIPEAFLVEEESEDGIVFNAEPWLPWWKRKRFVGFLLLFAVIVLAIAIGVGTHVGNRNTNVLAAELTPTISPAPSLSAAPSSSPTDCVNQIMTSNMQRIDLKDHLLINNPRDVKIAVDKRNMVVVALDGKYCTDSTFSSCNRWYDGPVYVTFYSLDSDDKWQRVSAPFRVDDLGGSYSVAMSGETVLVGFPYANDDAGTVLVYKKNLFGEWDRVENPFNRDNTTRLGGSIDIDGNLASVGNNNRAHLYHLSGDNWVQIGSFKIGFVRGTVFGFDCSIAGDIIVLRNSTDEGFHKLQLYKYDTDLDEAIAIQDPIVTGDGYVERQCFSSDGTNYTDSYINKLPRAMSCTPHDFSLVSSLGLSKDYLVYRKHYTHDGIFIYHRDETKQTFTFHKQLNITGSSDNSLAIDNDILVAGGDNKTYIYSLQDGDEYHIR